MNLRKKAITDIFTKLGKKSFSIWLSGEIGEGEHKVFNKNGKLAEHSSWKKGEVRDIK